MPAYSGFQLALELSNIFPVKEATSWVVTGAANQILSFARDLRKTGSDLVVEEDLAGVFGRGKVSFELERNFKEAVKIHKITPLSKGSEIELVSGPGPTLIRAFNEPAYFATVITLSMLSYYHNRVQLATMLAQSLTKRLEMGIQGASNPGYEGIVGTLAACSSQSSAFSWAYYSEIVENRLQASMPAYRYSRNYTHLSPSLLLGAMDYLYVVQRFSDDRKIAVSNQMGCITLIIWAHYVLELTVVIMNTPSGTIVFGNSNDPHVYINWVEEDESDFEPQFFYHKSGVADPAIRLYEKDISIILSESKPDPDQRFGPIIPEDRHPLRGYGTTYFRRNLNAKVGIDINDSVYEEIVKIITALAVHASRRLERDLDFLPRYLKLCSSGRASSASESVRRWTDLEMWRVLASAELIFTGIYIDRAGVNTHVNFLAKTKLDETTLPSSLDVCWEKLKIGLCDPFHPSTLLRQVEYLANIVLILSHVEEIENCGDMPLLFEWGHTKLGLTMREILKGPDQRCSVEPQNIFHAVVSLLSSTVLEDRDDTHRSSNRSTFLYSCSDFGWSVFMSTILDKDPALTRPEIVHVMKGTPTNAKTKEQKLRLRDGTEFRDDYCLPIICELEEEPRYIPRTVATLGKRTEYCSIRSQEFEVSLCYTVVPTKEWRRRNVDQLKATIGYRSMHDALWQTFSTETCEHVEMIDSHPRYSFPPTKLGPTAAALLGWNTSIESIREFPYNVVILLTRGELHIRWLALCKVVVERARREVMLRTPDCCDACALDQVASKLGKWVLIL